MSALKFIVLSDLHLGARGTAVNGLDPAARLATAVDSINRDHADAAFVLIAGDLADRGEVAAYRLLQELLAPLAVPFHLTLGNHDDRASFVEVWGTALDDPAGRISSVHDTGGYRVILLDSSEPGLVGGRLCEGRYGWLAARLDEATDRPVILVMHHHANRLSLPVDEIALEDGQRLARVLAGHPDIRMLVSGHVHIATAGTWRGYPVTTLAGSHYSVNAHLPGMAGAQRRLEGPAQMAILMADTEGVTVHFVDHLDRHLDLAPGLFGRD